MSDQRPPEPRCADCGARDVPIDTDGLCQACFTARGFRAMAEMLQHGAQPTEEPRHEPATGRRLAAIITAAALRMPPDERLQLWLECYRLMGATLDAETH